MIVAGIGWVSNQTSGSVCREGQKRFEDSRLLYQQLEQEGFFSVPFTKVRWWNTVSQRYCLAAGLVLRDVVNGSADKLHLDSLEMGMVSLSRDGALQPNLDYYKDYVQSGRKLARGNLFIHTLPTSPLAETAITFGFKGPVFHLSAAEPKLNLLFDRCESLGRRAEGLNLLCCVASAEAVICFFLKPDHAGTQGGLFSLKEMNARLGNLWDLKDVFRTLKIKTEMVQSGTYAK